ncbi:50S ribosomal protein L23 [Methylacidimicrobium cyclopophantes]|uniref:Large ribosomal subunit protein uL23 n=1 Tax=Methylacidimicrobium cyclopophantes TaxID=1041766 RepID=A0A5E6M900_9BACT|nr:50S ribosomal protein L23 [Methylacidimicrobium cyclopophantes]VVM05864.1 50S ribosomal protein L23 [Methylacidimicrobium cyclopophantes]
MRDHRTILRRIWMTEKATILGETRNQYLFEVPRDATKQEIRKAVERAFSKKVVAVNTLRSPGKIRRGRVGRVGKSPTRKKAIVTLAPGEKLDLTA